MYNILKQPIIVLPLLAAITWFSYYGLLAYKLVEYNPSVPKYITVFLLVLVFIINGIKAYLEGR